MIFRLLVLLLLVCFCPLPASARFYYKDFRDVAHLRSLGSARQQMMIALAAYASYVINATQFVLKLRAARRDERIVLSSAPYISGSEA